MNRHYSRKVNKLVTVNHQKRPPGLILSVRVQMRVLLEFGYFYLLFFKFTAGLIRTWVLFEGGSLLRIYGISYGDLAPSIGVVYVIKTQLQYIAMWSQVEGLYFTGSYSHEKTFKIRFTLASSFSLVCISQGKNRNLASYTKLRAQIFFHCKFTM